MKSENEIKFANVSRDINLFGKKCYFVEVCSPVYASFWAHDDIRIPYDFKFYVGLPHPTSADVFSLFVMFFLRELFGIYNEKCPFALSN